MSADRGTLPPSAYSDGAGCTRRVTRTTVPDRSTWPTGAFLRPLHPDPMEGQPDTARASCRAERTVRDARTNRHHRRRGVTVLVRESDPGRLACAGLTTFDSSSRADARTRDRQRR